MKTDSEHKTAVLAALGQLNRAIREAAEDGLTVEIAEREIRTVGSRPHSMYEAKIARVTEL